VSALPITPAADIQPQLLIAGRWVDGEGAENALFDPATGTRFATYRGASMAQVDAAIAAAQAAFAGWRATPAAERSAILRRAAALLRERLEEIARTMTREQGKPLVESRGEMAATCEILEWNAEEGRRLYGRIIPPRGADQEQLVLREPVGPVAAFTPWNFPATTPARKISGALAAGCTCVIKPAEETPLSCIAIGRALADAGLPAGVLSIVYGDAAAISNRLLESPVIRKISFTGSTRVGRLLAEHAGRTLKKATLELGGHAPVVVFEDADLELAVSLTAALKYRNAGQICISPTRFHVHESVMPEFLQRFTAYAKQLRVGHGLESGTTMGPLANPRRQQALGSLVDDAVGRGARMVAGATSVPANGWFFPPTVIEGGALDARIMSEEPFGPVAVIRPFKTFDEAMTEANRLPFGLASYVFSKGLRNARRAAAAIEAGMVAVNSVRVAWPETPFGGVKDSGSGSEGGSEGLEGYTVVKSVSLGW
jgi:succinate-semialdehyde dehydrogenase / glutarate-semialdehyde dehydrogenase